MTTPNPAPDQTPPPAAPFPPVDAPLAQPASPAAAPSYGVPPAGYGPSSPPGPRGEANPWHGLTSYWVTYPAGFGLIGLAFSALLPFLSRTESAVQAALAGAGFVVLGVAIYAEILVGLLYLVRRISFEGVGKLVWLVGTALFAGLAYVSCLAMGIDPWLLTIVAVFAGMVTVPVGQWIARTVLHGRRVPTLICLGICALFVVISLAMLPMSLGG